MLGVGAGWYGAEHEAYDFPFPPVRERMDELDRQLEHVTRELARLDSRPRIVVGGSARPRTVRAAAAHADEYNTLLASVDDTRERRRAVDDAARSEGREPLAFSVMGSAFLGRDDAEARDRWRAAGRDGEPGQDAIFGGIERAAAQLRELEAVGVERAMLRQPAHEDLESVALLGELARAVA